MKTIKAGVSCTEPLSSLQQPWVRLLALGRLLRVPPALSSCFLSHLQLILRSQFDPILDFYICFFTGQVAILFLD